jgi:hypothetical protein
VALCTACDAYCCSGSHHDFSWASVPFYRLSCGMFVRPCSVRAGHDVLLFISLTGAQAHEPTCSCMALHDIRVSSILIRCRWNISHKSAMASIFARFFGLLERSMFKHQPTAPGRLVCTCELMSNTEECLHRPTCFDAGLPQLRTAKAFGVRREVPRGARLVVSLTGCLCACVQSAATSKRLSAGQAPRQGKYACAPQFSTQP